MEKTIIELEQVLKEAREAYDKAIAKSMREQGIARTVRLAKLLDKKEGK